MTTLELSELSQDMTDEQFAELLDSPAGREWQRNEDEMLARMLIEGPPPIADEYKHFTNPAQFRDYMICNGKEHLLPDYPAKSTRVQGNLFTGIIVADCDIED
jgi:hypothetical protein